MQMNCRSTTAYSCLVAHNQEFPPSFQSALFALGDLELLNIQVETITVEAFNIYNMVPVLHTPYSDMYYDVLMSVGYTVVASIGGTDDLGLATWSSSNPMWLPPGYSSVSFSNIGPGSKQPQDFQVTPMSRGTKSFLTLDCIATGMDSDLIAPMTLNPDPSGSGDSNQDDHMLLPNKKGQPVPYNPKGEPAGGRWSLIMNSGPCAAAVAGYPTKPK